MPRTFRLFCIGHTTTITLMDGNLNIIQGDLRRMDQSTAITNMNALNIESLVTERQSPPTTSLIVDEGKVVIGFLKPSRALIYKYFNSAPTTMVSLDPSTGTANHEHDTDSASGRRQTLMHL